MRQGSVWVCLAGILWAGSMAAAPFAGDAQRLVQAAGVDRGVCVVVAADPNGAGPGLAAGLAASGRFAVHVLAADEPTAERARQAVGVAGVQGFCAVDRLPLASLPYRDRLVNLLVLDDLGKAQAAGLPDVEARRVLAPGGRLCAGPGPQWVVTTQPQPPEMDDWPQEDHGPDGNAVSRDTLLRFPVAYRWSAGLPMNLHDRERQANTWSTVRGFALAGGRCFTLSTSELENVAAASFLPVGRDQYVTARDAFNGMLLWRRSVGLTYYGGLRYTNKAPFLATAERVYAATGEGRLVVFAAASGETSRTLATAFAPGKILLDQGILVVASWQDGTIVGGFNGVDRRRLDFKVGSGAVEAFDEATGQRLWNRAGLVTTMRSAGGLLFLLQREGADRREEESEKKLDVLPPRPAQKVVAVDLRTGVVRWEVPGNQLEADEYLRVDFACPQAVLVLHETSSRKGSLLAAADGRLLATTPYSHPVLLDGVLNVGSKSYEPASGKELGPAKVSIGAPLCTPNLYVNGFVISNRGGFGGNATIPLNKGFRGSCLFGSVPAYGMLFTPQNWCNCVPTQIAGLLAVGPVRADPTVAEMVGERPLEKGPAFGAAAADSAAGAWPTFRHDASRSSASATPAPVALAELWRVAAAGPVDPASPVVTSWREQLSPPITAPVVAEGLVVLADSDRDQIVALEAATGAVKWRADAGSRVDCAPTLHRGLCLFGAHDGRLHALRLADGGRAWTLRAAPREERLLSYGKIESPWPVNGSVLVDGDTGWAVAGRTAGADGGLALLAFAPQDGSVRWARAIEPAAARGRVATVPVMNAGTVQVALRRFAVQTGEDVPNLTQDGLDKAAEIKRQEALRQQKAEEEKRRQAEAAKTAAAAAPATPPAQPPAAAPTPAAAADVVLPNEIALSFGNTGLADVVWPRLGNRKYGSMMLGNFGGLEVTWNDSVVCAVAGEGRQVFLAERAKIRPAHVPWKAADNRWKRDLPSGFQATSVVLCADAVLVAGGRYEGTPLTRQGFVHKLSLESGEMQASAMLPAPVVPAGLAAAGPVLYVALDDGSVACLGSR